MKSENERVINKIDKILNEITLQTNIILDGIQKIYSYVNDKEVHYIMENMFKSAIDLSKYINNILDYNKYLLSDTIEITLKETNILQIIKNIYNIYNVKMETYNINFNYKLTNDIRNYNYLIDEKYLTQIILNIIDIIIYDIESELTNINNNKIYINIEYINNYIEFNIYYTSNKDIIIKYIKNNVFDKYNIKYNIINELVNHLKGDIIYYNKLDDTITFDKQITLKLLSDKVKICNNNLEDITINKKQKPKTIAILSSNSLYLNIIINALDYYNNKYKLSIIPLNNIKLGFDYVNKNYYNIDVLILDIEYNNLLGLNILNNLYKHKNMKFILTTSIESDNIKNYIGSEFGNNRIFIYIKPINTHNIIKIENFLFADNNDLNTNNNNDNDNDNDNINKDKLTLII